jgi:hypothetical protein
MSIDNIKIVLTHSFKHVVHLKLIFQFSRIQSASRILTTMQLLGNARIILSKSNERHIICIVKRNLNRQKLT